VSSLPTNRAVPISTRPRLASGSFAVEAESHRSSLRSRQGLGPRSFAPAFAKSVAAPASQGRPNVLQLRRSRSSPPFLFLYPSVGPPPTLSQQQHPHSQSHSTLPHATQFWGGRPSSPSSSSPNGLPLLASPQQFSSPALSIEHWQQQQLQAQAHAQFLFQLQSQHQHQVGGPSVTTDATGTTTSETRTAATTSGVSSSTRPTVSVSLSGLGTTTSSTVAPTPAASCGPGLDFQNFTPNPGDFCGLFGAVRQWPASSHRPSHVRVPSPHPNPQHWQQQQQQQQQQEQQQQQLDSPYSHWQRGRPSSPRSSQEVKTPGSQAPHQARPAAARVGPPLCLAPRGFGGISTCGGAIGGPSTASRSVASALRQPPTRQVSALHYEMPPVPKEQPLPARQLRTLRASSSVTVSAMAPSGGGPSSRVPIPSPLP